MNCWWALRLAQADIGALGKLRCRQGLEVCEQAGELWLRGYDEEAAGKLERLFRTLPGRRYQILPDQQLLAAGALVPQGHAPQEGWTPIDAWLTPQLPPAGFAASVAGRAALQLVRSHAMQPANLLWTSPQTWRAYAALAPQARLDRLAFAMNPGGDVLIRGTPIPAILGERWVETSGVCVPAGWRWEPALDPLVVRELLGLEAEDLALLHPAGDWEHIPAADFVLATRSAVRLSTEGEDDGR